MWCQRDWWLLAGAGMLALLGAAALAQPVDPLRLNTVELQADVQREVGNDTLIANLYIELNDANPVQLANALNRAANEALKIAADFKTVRTRSGGNQTYPVYERSQRLTGWRGRAEIRLESHDFASSASLIGKLQSGMQLAGVSFSVSTEARKAVENELIAEAVAAFRARADIVRLALAGKSYKLRRMAINTGGMAPPRPMLMQRAAAMASAEVAPPQFESGVSVVTVNVSGAIEVE